MAKENKNPYEPDTPEWQIFSNIEHTQSLVDVYFKDYTKSLEDAERYKQKQVAAQNKLTLFRAALDKLTK